MRIDLHVHSKYSDKPSASILKKIGAPECHTEPARLYAIAKARGMSLVTITDHNCIDGALKIAHLPDTFISEEITTFFPEDGCKIHVLAYNITEKQHSDIQRARRNIYDLVAYLQQEEIVHVLAHALCSLNSRLRMEHIEKCLLLFKNLELNGARSDESNACLIRVVQHLDRQAIERLADKFDIQPAFTQPWEKNFVGGSDDHSSLNIARTHTVVENGACVPDLLYAVRCGRTKVFRTPSSPHAMAQTLYGITYQFFRKKHRLERYVSKDKVVTFLDRSLRMSSKKPKMPLVSRVYYAWSNRRAGKADRTTDALVELIQRHSRYILAEDATFAEKAAVDASVAPSCAHDENWYIYANRLANRVIRQYSDNLARYLADADLLKAAHAVGSASGLYSLLSPYFIAYRLYSQDRAFNEQMAQRFKLPRDHALPAGGIAKIAFFADTLAVPDLKRLRLHMMKSRISHGVLIEELTCTDRACSLRPVAQNFTPVGACDVPNDAGDRIYYPPLLEMLRYCYENRYAAVLTSSPALMGLAAWGVAKVLDLPLYGIYRPDMVKFVQFLAGDSSVEDFRWKYLLWYLGLWERIYVYDESDAAQLRTRGVPATKIFLVTEDPNEDLLKKVIPSVASASLDGARLPLAVGS